MNIVPSLCELCQYGQKNGRICYMPGCKNGNKFKQRGVEDLKAQVKERELTIEKIEAKCCQCHAGHVAQVAVLRGALFHVRDEIDKYGSQANLAWLLESAEEALSTTPAEASERVNRLVEALEKLARLGGPGDGYGNSDGNVIAQRALTAWRGQKN